MWLSSISMLLNWTSSAITIQKIHQYRTKSLDSAKMSANMYDNKFMDYYNYLFTDLAGNFIIDPSNVHFVLIFREINAITIEQYLCDRNLLKYNTGMMLIMYYFYNASLISFHRSTDKQLANDIVTGSGTHDSGCLLVLCVIMGSQVHGQPQAI